MSAILTLEHVCKTFGSHPVVQDLSFSVEPGEVFGFLGPNGAGKTTTIKIILGLLHMDSGSILIDGHSVEDDFAAAMAHVSGIVEHPDMYKYLSGYDNLLLQAHACGADRAQIDRVVEMVGMQARIRDKFKTYSLGMKQRLGVAQALLHDPKLMILDEPTNGLDPAGIKDFRDLIRRLAHENGIAVLVSSHILQEMQLMCDRVGIIDRGTLKQISSVEELTHQSTRYRFTVRPGSGAAAAACARPAGRHHRYLCGTGGHRGRAAHHHPKAGGKRHSAVRCAAGRQPAGGQLHPDHGRREHPCVI